MENQHGRPFITVPWLVSFRSPDRIGQQVACRSLNDLARDERCVANELGGLAAVPAVPSGHAVGAPGAGEAEAFFIEVEPARPGAKRLDVELQVPALDLAVEA